eukprot:c35826_g1_i1 orf=3-161(-)
MKFIFRLSSIAPTLNSLYRLLRRLFPSPCFRSETVQTHFDTSQTKHGFSTMYC